jgi:hypothetical protein
MPRTRWTLTRTEQNEYAARAEWLAAAGVVIEIPEPPLSQPSALRISQYGPEFHNIVVNLHPGRIAVIVGVRLIAARTGITVYDCECTLPWKGPELFLWNAAERSTYRLTKGLEFSRDEVLNHRVEEGMPLRRGLPVEGILVATGFAPLPEQYGHGMPVNVAISLIDQFDNAFPLEVVLRVNRRIGAQKVARPSEHRGLFDAEEFNTQNQKRVPKESGEVRLRVHNQAHARHSAQGSANKTTEQPGNLRQYLPAQKFTEMLISSEKPRI